MLSVKAVAKIINNQCQTGKYFWAIGLIKETLSLWKQTVNQYLLCEEAQGFVTNYLEGKNGFRLDVLEERIKERSKEMDRGEK